MKEQSFIPPSRMLMGPGPSDVSARVLEAMARPTIGHLDPEFISMMDEIKNLLQYTFITSNELTFAVSAPGMAGMECCFANLVEENDKVIICKNGFFGERMKENVERFGGIPVMVNDDWGQKIDLNKVEECLKENPDTKLVVATHAETSTGVLQNIEELGNIVSKTNALFMIDCVTSIAGTEILFDDWNIDFSYAGSQKCLASPPGLSPCAMSEKAYQYIKNRKTKPSSWYLDLSLVNDYWDKDHIPQYTVAVSSIYALYESLRLLEEEGLENRWNRHKVNAEKLRKGLTAIELNLPISPNDRLDQLTVVTKPDHIDDVEFRNKLIYDYNIEIGRGLGDFAGKVFRIGLMGESCKSEYVDQILEVFQKEI